MGEDVPGYRINVIADALEKLAALKPHGSERDRDMQGAMSFAYDLSAKMVRTLLTAPPDNPESEDGR